MIGSPSAEPSKEQLALALFVAVLLDLVNPRYDLVSCFRKALRACQLLGWTKQAEWCQQELNGYQDEASLPFYRKNAMTVLEWKTRDIHAAAAHVVAAPSELPDEPGVRNLYDDVATLVRTSAVGFMSATGKTTHRRFMHGSSEWYQVETVHPSTVQTVVHRATNALYGLCSQAEILLKFGNLAQALFQQYRSRAETALSKLGLAEHLEAIETNLTSANPMSWRQAVLGCRNILFDLSNKLWLVEDTEYPYIPSRDDPKRGMSLARDQSKNRLEAYLHQKGVIRSGDARSDLLRRQLDRLSEFQRDLHDFASTGKGKITGEDAESCVVQTFLFLGELARLTDLSPVTQIVPPS